MRVSGGRSGPRGRSHLRPLGRSAQRAEADIPHCCGKRRWKLPRQRRKRQEGQKEGQGTRQEGRGQGQPVIARKNIFRVMFNEITSKAIKAAFEHPERSTKIWWTRNKRAGCWTVWWATRFRRCCGTRFAGAIRRARTNRGAAPDRGPRARYSRLHPGGVLDDSRRNWPPAGRPRSKPSSPNLRARTLKSTTRPKRMPSWLPPEKRNGKLPGVTQKESAVLRHLHSPLPSFSRPLTTDCATRPNAPWALRSGSTKALSWARKARLR